jgi:hypothetical protein
MLGAQRAPNIILGRSASGAEIRGSRDEGKALPEQGPRVDAAAPPEDDEPIHHIPSAWHHGRA